MSEDVQAPFGDTTKAPAKTRDELRLEWSKRNCAIIGHNDEGAGWRVFYWKKRDEGVASVTGPTPDAALDAAMAVHP